MIDGNFMSLTRRIGIKYPLNGAAGYTDQLPAETPQYFLAAEKLISLRICFNDVSLVVRYQHEIVRSLVNILIGVLFQEKSSISCFEILQFIRLSSTFPVFDDCCLQYIRSPSNSQERSAYIPMGEIKPHNTFLKSLYHDLEGSQKQFQGDSPAAVKTGFFEKKSGVMRRILETGNLQ